MNVFDYQSGRELKGKPTRALIRASKRESSGTGAVGATLRRGWWHYVPVGRESGSAVRVVFVQ